MIFSPQLTDSGDSIFSSRRMGDTPSAVQGSIYAAQLTDSGDSIFADQRHERDNGPLVSLVYSDQRHVNGGYIFSPRRGLSGLISLTTSPFDMRAEGLELPSGDAIEPPEFHMKAGPYIYPSSDFTETVFSVAEFDMVALALSVEYFEYSKLSVPEFHMEAAGPGYVHTLDYPRLSSADFAMVSTSEEHKIKVSMEQDFNIAFDTIGGTYSATGLTVIVGGYEVYQATADGSHSFNLTIPVDNPGVEFKCVSQNDFVGDVDNVYLTRGHK